MFTGGLIEGTNELCVMTQFLEHTNVFAAHRAVHDSSSGPLCVRPSGADRDRAVDDGQCRLIALDVAHRYSDEVLDLEWIADVQNFNTVADINGLYVHSDDLFKRRDELEKRLADFSETYDDDF
jgi:hypothetical protein